MALASSQASLWSSSQLPVGAWGVKGTLSERVTGFVVEGWVVDGLGEEVSGFMESVGVWVNPGISEGCPLYINIPPIRAIMIKKAIIKPDFFIIIDSI